MGEGWRTRLWTLARSLSGDERPRSEASYPADFSAEEIQTIEQVRPYTMTTAPRIVSLIRATEFVLTARIPGDFVECGVWKGGSMMAAALTMRRLQDTTRTLHLYDTYDGMPAPTDDDADHKGHSAAAQLASQPKTAQVWARAQIDEVMSNMRSTEYPEERLRFVKGMVEDTIPADAPEQIALLRLDTDWYSSTRHELEHFYPRLSPGGVLIIDDYGHWQGARKAVDEYFQGDRRVLLCRIDQSARIAVKSS